MLDGIKLFAMSELSQLQREELPSRNIFLLNYVKSVT